MKTQDEMLRKLLELTMRKLRNEDISEEISVLEEKEKREEMMLLLEMLKRFWENEVNALLFSPKPPPSPFLFSHIPLIKHNTCETKACIESSMKDICPNVIWDEPLCEQSILSNILKEFNSRSACSNFLFSALLYMPSPRFSTFFSPFLFWKTFLKKCRDCSH